MRFTCIVLFLTVVTFVYAENQTHRFDFYTTIFNLPINSQLNDTRIYKDAYYNFNQLRFDFIKRKASERQRIDERKSLYWTVFFWDHFLLESLIITPIHEQAHYEVLLTDLPFVHVTAAGINMHTLIARDYHLKRLVDDQNHIFERGVYLSNKLTGLVYSALIQSGDPTYYRYYVNVSKNQLAVAYTIPTLLSEGVIHYVINAREFIRHGKTNLDPIQLKWDGFTINWPEFYTFMNPTNVSVLTETVVSHSSVKNTFFMMGVESPVYGENSPIEVGVGFATTFSNVQLFSECAFNTGGYFFRSKVTFPLNSHISSVYSTMVGSNSTLKQFREWPFTSYVQTFGLSIKI